MGYKEYGKWGQQFVGTAVCGDSSLWGQQFETGSSRTNTHNSITFILFFYATFFGPQFLWRAPRFWQSGGPAGPNNFRLNSISDNNK